MNGKVVSDKLPVVIRRYADHRLFNTSKHLYVTLDDLHQMMEDGVAFVVYDTTTGWDITTTLLGPKV